MLSDWDPDCLTNHQWKAHPCQSPLIWLRRLSLRWRRAKHWAHQEEWWRWYEQPVTSQLQLFAIARYPPTGNRVSLSASTRVRGMHWTGAITVVSSWQNRSWKFWRGLWTASSEQLVSINDSYFDTQPAGLHHCAWSLVMLVLPLRGPLCGRPCYSWRITQGMCQEALDLERSNEGERAESKCRKDKDHDLWYRPGPPAEFRQVSMCRLSRWSGQQQQALGAQEMQWAQALDKRPWLQMYTVPGNFTPLGQQTTEGSPSRTWQAEGGSFLLLPRRHALSSWWLWIFNHNMYENCLEEVKELLPLLFFCHLSFKTHGHMYSSCVQSAMLHASETWSLTKQNLQCLWNDRAMIRQICNIKPQDIATIRSNELLAYLALRIWTLS